MNDIHPLNISCQAQFLKLFNVVRGHTKGTLNVLPMYLIFCNHVNLSPNSTDFLDGVIRTQPIPSVFLKPRVRTSEVNLPTCLGGKLTTQQTSMPNNSSLVWAPTAWTLELLIPISDP